MKMGVCVQGNILPFSRRRLKKNEMSLIQDLLIICSGMRTVMTQRFNEEKTN
jgi:hypothetical protein